MKFRYVGRVRHQVLSQYRRFTSPLRVLPNFMIIGAMKSGTSSLFHYLSQHPLLVPASHKEVHFFDMDESVFGSFESNLCRYRSYFSIGVLMPSGALSYEATPRYLCHGMAAQRIHMLIPDAKLIVMLRNPTDRAISHYFHTRTNIANPAFLHATLLNDLESFNHAQDYSSYIGRGVYLPQIQRYLNYFDRQSLHIINSELFFKDPVKVLSTLFNFLGVHDIRIPNLLPRNVCRRERQIWTRTRTFLNDFYRVHNENLFDFVGTRFGWNDP